MTDTKKPAKPPMSFTRNQAKLLGVISWVPVCWIALTMIVMLTAGRSELSQKILLGSVAAAFIVINTLTLILIIYYIILISREADLTSNQKYSWGWIVFLVSVMAFPVVWHKFVWSKVNQLDSSTVKEAAQKAPNAIRKKALWLRVLSWAPICMIILGIAVLVLAEQAAWSPEVKVPFILALFIGIMLLSIFLTVYFCILINKDRDLTSEQKHNLYWTIFLLNFWAFPAVWRKLLWQKLKQPVDEESVERDASDSGGSHD